MNRAYPFRAPLADILFSLRHIGGMRDETSAEVIHHFARFAEGELAPLDALGDALGCQLSFGQVKMPEGFREAYHRLCADGWQGLTIPEAYGGQEMSPLTLAGVSEIFSGANHSLQMITSLPGGAAKVLEKYGTPAQCAAYLPKLASGEWLSTMALTEPQAGSDLGAIRCRARLGADGKWRITGEKIFISGGGQDLSQMILHLVLARSSDAAGVKGLSLFAVTAPSGGGNGVTVLRLEEKMGLHASPTCQMAFDGAIAELIGTEGKGLEAMFAMMNHARLDVALQGVAHAARAADIAQRHAVQRLQGRDAAGEPLPLIAHHDVAEMVAECQRLAIGSRALCHLIMAQLDDAESAELVDFLTPVAKVYCTQAALRAADLSIQVLGGYGYLKEYGAEQNWRDARICAIYEGANGIHARGLASRAINLSNGAAIVAFAQFCAKADIDATPWVKEAQALRLDPAPATKAKRFMDLTADYAIKVAWYSLLKVADFAPDPELLRKLAP